MISCYSPKQPTSYSLVDVTDSLGLAFPLPASVLTGTKITGANESKSNRSSSFLKKIIIIVIVFLGGLYLSVLCFPATVNASLF